MAGQEAMGPTSDDGQNDALNLGGDEDYEDDEEDDEG